MLEQWLRSPLSNMEAYSQSSKSLALELSKGSKMSVDYIKIRIRGSETRVPSVQIDDRTIVATGKCLNIASARDEELVEGQVVRDLIQGHLATEKQVYCGYSYVSGTGLGAETELSLFFRMGQPGGSANCELP